LCKQAKGKLFVTGHESLFSGLSEPKLPLTRAFFNYLYTYLWITTKIFSYDTLTPRSAAAYFVRVLRENGSDSDRAKSAQSKLSACSALYGLIPQIFGKVRPVTYHHKLPARQPDER